MLFFRDFEEKRKLFCVSREATKSDYYFLKAITKR
jgi:hypothetical protein